MKICCLPLALRAIFDSPSYADQPGAAPGTASAARIDGRKTVTLRGTRNPRIEGLADEGPLDDMKRIAGLSFRFKPSAAQAAALEQLLEDQQNPSSPLYHAWLSPEEFGERFGLSENDLANVTDWLAIQGFQVDAVARSRTYVTFSATTAQVRDTFRTELHRFRADGEMHYANVSDVAIPADLEQLVYSVRGLDDFRLKPAAQLKPMVRSPGGNNYSGPGDLATIYNVNPLYQKGINGSGQKIVVLGQSAFKMSDVRDCRQKFALPSNDPSPMLVPGLPDPGINDDVMEAILDLDLAGRAPPTRPSCTSIRSTSTMRLSMPSIRTSPRSSLIAMGTAKRRIFLILVIGTPTVHWRSKPMRKG
jgi:hypothetical protein